MAGLCFSLSSPGRRAGRVVAERRDPVIHTDYRRTPNFVMDCRVKPGNDKKKFTRRFWIPALALSRSAGMTKEGRFSRSTQPLPLPACGERSISERSEEVG
jgi:hypothetical protein